MGLVQTIPPARYPVHLDEVKLHRRIDSTAEDSLLTRLIAAATARVEIYIGSQLVTATWQLTLDAFPAIIYIPYPPLQSVSSIAYVDEDGATQTLAETTDYVVDTSDFLGRIAPAYNEAWPSTRSEHDAVTITYVAGYATPFTAVAATDICTWLGATPVSAAAHVLSNSGGALPTGLSAQTLYYVRDVSGSTCKWAATSGGTAIDLTDAGTGTHYVGIIPDDIVAALLLTIGALYENREPEMADDPAVRALLWPYRTMVGM